MNSVPSQNQLDMNSLPCVDKMSFDSKDVAQDTATVAEYQHGAKVKPYLCQHCSLWHLASK